MSNCSTQTVVLGFDALSMSYLDKFDLPNIDSLRDQGVSLTLESTFPPWTGSAWPSMYTGVDPSFHGVYSFFDFGSEYPNDAELVDRTDVNAPALWNYLSALDQSTVTLNMPVTHPAEPVNGVLIPGYLAPEESEGYPNQIRNELSEALGTPYRIYAREETGDDVEAVLDSFIDLIDLRRRAAAYLLESRDPDVAIIQVQKTDTVFHKCSEIDAFRRVYRAADELVGTVIDTVPNDANILICSDHGIGPSEGFNIYVNEILRHAGFISATECGESPTLSSAKRELIGETPTQTSSSPGKRVISKLARGLARFGIYPGDVYTIADRIGIEDVLRKLLPNAGKSLSRTVDWRSSHAFCRSGPELGIRINLEGREQEGIVPREDYESVRNQIITILSEMSTPMGRSLFDWVKRREEVYSGPYTESAADVLFSPSEMDHIVATNLLGKELLPIDKYNHKQEGVFIGSGPAFHTGNVRDQIKLTDVAPIIMALADCAVPERMTGSVPSNLLRVETTVESYGGIEYGRGEPSTDSEVESRLADLGYL